MKDTKDSIFDSSEQLKLLKVKCQKFAPKISNLYELYLQELRSILIHSVRSSVINLVIARSNSVLGIQTKEIIKEFQDNVDELTVRCRSHLTVEHLDDLARKLDKENKVLLEKTKAQVSDALTNKVELHFREQQEEPEDHNHNINIDSELPIENPLYIKNWFTYQDSKEIIDRDKKEDEYISEVSYDSSKNNDSKIQSDLSSKNNKSKTQSGLSNDDSDYLSSSDNEKSKKLDVLKSLFSKASQIFETKTEQNISSINCKDNNKDLDSDENQKPELNLPDNPELLSLWINSFENALAQTLRNLSQGVNLELLKRGILNSIVPVSILDAVIMGQMNSEYSDSNLLKITVPANSSPFGEAIDLICLLIRTTELEFDNHRLRKIRTEINNHQKIVFKMVKQYRYWQSRSLADNIHQNWWQTPLTQSKTHPTDI